MKICAAALVTLAALDLACAARAQQCSTPVTSWQADYTLEATAANVSCGSGNGETCNVDQSASASGSFRTVTDQSCTALGWFSVVPIPTAVALANSDTDPCPFGAGATTQRLQHPTGGLTRETLNLDLTAGSYTFEPDAVSNAIDAIEDCNGHKSSESLQYIYTPLPFPGSPPWPPKFSLPTSIQQLTGSTSFQARTATAAAPANWTFKFTLTPYFTEDDDCDREHSSTIGCQNQRLGENVPLAGTGFHLHYASDRAQIGLANGAAAADAAMLGGWTLSVHHVYDPTTNTLFFGDGTQRNGYQIGTPVSFRGNRLVTSEDGTEIYVFDPSTGRHLETLKPLTGAIVYRFGYSGSGRLVTVTHASGNVTTIRRDGAGRPTAIVSPYGQRTTLAVDLQGFLSRLTDPLGHSTILVNTASGLLTSRTDANGNTYAYIYSAAGRLFKDADPAGGFTKLGRTAAVAGLGFTSTVTTAMGRTSEYQTAITAAWVQGGTAPYSEQHTNTWPDGLQTTSVKSLQDGALSDSFGLSNATSFSESLGPDPVWGIQVPVAASEIIAEGSLRMSLTATRSTTLKTAGNPFTVAKQTDTQIINGRTGTTTDSRSYNGFGELIGYTATAHGTVLYSAEYARDAAGRITGKAEKIAGVTNTYAYTYDASGRLVKAVKNGVADTYDYDSNSNRLTGDVGGTTAHGTYDAQDRLLSYGSAHYAYTANGELSKQTIGTKTTTYGYDVLGNLIAATLPDGTKITYVIDAENHRVGKAVNGKLATGFLYDGNTVAAQLDGGSRLVSQFVYATRLTTPDYMLRGGVTYQIFSDQLGSAVLVVNAATGAVAERIAYDAFGNVTEDTNPGLQPFRFAGGLYDPDIGLLRFGARDYDPKTGRWTAKDRVLFAAGDTNLYAYALGDPVSLTDVSGLQTEIAPPDTAEAAVEAAAGEVVGGPVATPWYVPPPLKDAAKRLVDWIKHKICRKCEKETEEKEVENNGTTAKELAEDQTIHVVVEATAEVAGEAAEMEVAGKAVGPALTAVEGSKQLAQGLIYIKQARDIQNKALNGECAAFQ